MGSSLAIAHNIAPAQNTKQRRAIEHRPLFFATLLQRVESSSGRHTGRQRAQAMKGGHRLANMCEGPLAELKAPQIAQGHHAKQRLWIIGIGELQHRKALVDLAKNITAHELVE